MKKSYEGHELVYKKLREKGLSVWGQKGSGSTGKSSHPEINNFLKDVLLQPYAPKQGRILELGCGTGPILRRVCKKTFSGVGIDISKTAITMAKEQSKGLDIKFKQGDACNLNIKNLGKFDIVIDGLCLHCITDIKDRKAYFDNVYKLLKDGGLYILLTMCSPMDRKRFFKECKGQKIIKKVAYVPFENKDCWKLTKFNGKYYLPTRYIGHWKDILSELKKAGLSPKLIRYNTHNDKDFCGTLMTGCLKG